MKDAGISRRRFLTSLGVLIGAGAAGGIAWWRQTDDPSGVASLEEAAPAPPGSSPAAGPAGRVRGVQAPTTTAGPSAATSPTTTAGPSAATSPTTTSSSATAPTSPSSTPAPSATTAPTSTTSTPATATTATSPVPTTAGPAPAGGEIEVLCREAWGAAPLQGEPIEHQIRRLTVHHTAVEMGSNTRAPRRMRSYQEYHQGQGWPDIAYHYLIDANGHVYEGRPYSLQGDTFTEYDPAGHFLVCCDGHFDRHAVPAAQLDALAGVLAWAAVRFGVGPSTIAGHRSYAATTCPGAALDAPIGNGTVRSLVEQRIAAHSVSMVMLCGPAGLGRVADIEAGRV